MIGDWNNSNCIFAVLPACLQNGDNPATFSAGDFSVYNGPVTSSTISMNLTSGYYFRETAEGPTYADGHSQYNNGKIEILDGAIDEPRAFFAYGENLDSLLEPDSEYGFEFDIDYLQTETGNTQYLFSFDWGNSESEALSARGSYGFKVLIADDGSIGITGRTGYKYDRPTAKVIIYYGKTDPIPAMSASRDNVHIVVNKLADFEMEVYVNGDPYAVTDGLPFVSGYSLELSESYPIIGYGGGPNRDNSDINKMIVYNAPLTSATVSTNYALGPDLSGLYGYDNEDGTLALEETQRQTSIGEWDNTNCILAILPKALQNAGNPPTFSAGNFPTYNGPRSNRTHIASFSGNRWNTGTYGGTYESYIASGSSYVDGVIDVDNDPVTVPGLYIDVAPEMVDLYDPTSKFTFEYFIDYDVDIFSGNNVILNLIQWGDSDGASSNICATYLIGSSLYFIIGCSNIIPERDTNKTTVISKYSNAIDAFSTTGQKHVVVVKDGEDVRFFVNSDEVTSMLAVVPWITTTGNNPVSGTMNYGPSFEFPYYMADLQSSIIYETALTSADIQTNYNLGPDLGGLKGSDNADGTMRLQVPTSVGSWDTTNVQFALLPKCLARGDNPSNFYTGTFPLYRNTDEITSAVFINYTSADGYQNGIIKTTSNTTGTLDILSNQMSAIEGDQKTICLMFDKDENPAHYEIIHYGIGTGERQWATFWQENVPSDVHRVEAHYYKSLYGYDGGSQMLPLSAMNQTSGTPYAMFLRIRPNDALYSNDWYIGSEKQQIALSPPTDKGILSGDTSFAFGNLPEAHMPVNDPNFTGYNTPAVYNLKAAIVYDKVLTDDEMDDVVNLGPSLGGLYGSDNGDGSLSLTSGTSLNGWNNSGCVFALLPRCLNDGNNPPSFHEGRFPIYNGPASENITTASFEGSYYVLDDNEIRTFSARMEYNEHDAMVKSFGTSSDEPALSIGVEEEFKKFFDKTSNVTLEYWLDWSPSTTTLPKYCALGWWINTDSSATPNTKFEMSVYFQYPYGDNNSEMRFRLATDTTTILRYSSTSQPLLSADTENTLLHVVVVKEQDDVRFYLNGSEIEYRQKVTWVDGDWTDKMGNGLVTHGLGYANGTSDSQFTDMRSMIFYNEALSDYQIQQNYNLGPGLGGLKGDMIPGGALRLVTSGTPISTRETFTSIQQTEMD